MGREDQGVSQSRGRYQVIPRTLCFLRNGNLVLLLRGSPKKRLWPGLYNGVGGHVEQGEDIQTAVIREVREETGLEIRDVRLRAVVHADAGDPTVGILFFVFTADADAFEVHESEEGTLEWVPADHLPMGEMVEDLPLLLPKVLHMGPTDPPFFAHYGYDAENRLLVTIAGSAGSGSQSVTDPLSG